MNPARDFIGYGRNPPKVRWPNNSRLTVSIVTNYEAGAERTVGGGDKVNESLGELTYQALEGIRDLTNESTYEYGSRVGAWRLLDLFRRYDVRTTWYVCGMALEINPELAKAITAEGHEPCSHGYRWSEVFSMTRDEEKEEIRKAVDSIRRTTGRRPVGWYCRYGPSVNTRELLAEEGGFIYDSDASNDDTPYFATVNKKRWLVLPYSLDANDIKYWMAPGFSTADQYLEYLVQTFDTLYAEGERYPRMMSVPLHDRVSGRPARITAVERFIKHAKSHPGVWFATREEIAKWWTENA